VSTCYVLYLSCGFFVLLSYPSFDLLFSFSFCFLFLLHPHPTYSIQWSLGFRLCINSPLVPSLAVPPGAVFCSGVPRGSPHTPCLT
jgi:hypothetical protein